MDKVSIANKLKEKGNEYFKQKNFHKAYDCYTEALQVNPDGGEETAAYHKNRAAVLLKQEKYAEVVSDCTKALAFVSNDTKALYRRCVALEQLGRYEQAYRDAEDILYIEPKNKAIQEIVGRVFPHLKKENPEKFENSVCLIRGKKYPAQNPDGSDTVATWKGPKEGFVYDDGTKVNNAPKLQRGKKGDSFTAVINNKTSHIAEWDGDCYVCLDGTKIDSVHPDDKSVYNVMNTFHSNYREGKDGWELKSDVVPESKEQKAKRLEALLERGIVLEDTPIMDLVVMATMVLRRMGNQQFLDPYITNLSEIKDIFRKGGIKLLAGGSGDHAANADGNNNRTSAEPASGTARDEKTLEKLKKIFAKKNLSCADVDNALKLCGVKNPNRVSKCLRRGIQKKYVRLDVPKPLEVVVLEEGCPACGDVSMLKATVGKLLHQPLVGDDYESNSMDAKVFCRAKGDHKGCYGEGTQGYYVEDICSGQPAFTDGKGYNHCGYCPGFGECIGDYRTRHCLECGEHYYGGFGRIFKCDRCHPEYNEENLDRNWDFEDMTFYNKSEDYDDGYDPMEGHGEDVSFGEKYREDEADDDTDNDAEEM